MTMLLTDWLRPLIAGALLVSLLLAFAPEGRARAALKFAAGVLMTVLLLRPLTGPEPETLYDRLTSGLTEAAALEETAVKQAEAVYDSFICRETEEYIWSAARELGIDTLGVRVVTDAEATGTVPREIFLRGCVSETQRCELSRLLETELGIGPEHQYWSGTDAD